jgi:hypothetical protein
MTGFLNLILLNSAMNGRLALTAALCGAVLATSGCSQRAHHRRMHYAQQEQIMRRYEHGQLHTADVLGNPEAAAHYHHHVGQYPWEDPDFDAHYTAYRRASRSHMHAPARMQEQ